MKAAGKRPEKSGPVAGEIEPPEMKRHEITEVSLWYPGILRTRVWRGGKLIYDDAPPKLRRLRANE